MTEALHRAVDVLAAPARLGATPRVIGQAHVVPEPMGQQELWDGHFSRLFGANPTAAAVWRGTGIATRHGVVNPVREDISGWSTGERMRRYQVEALPLGVAAVDRALRDAGLTPEEVGLLTVVSCTGYATPGLDIRISEELGMSADVQRLLVGHMGCYAAIPGLGAVADFVGARGRPAVMLCLELTSLHAQPPSPTLLAGRPTEADVEQLVAHALFADAAAAIVLAPADHPAASARRSGAGTVASLAARGVEVVDVVARTDWTTQSLMRWDVTDLGFKMALSAKVPAVLAGHVADVVDGLLESHGYDRDDVAGWAVHPGGRRILEVVQERLALPEGALAASYSVLKDFGNCSSPTVLLVLERMLAGGTLPPGRPVVAMAFGPGLTLYAALLHTV